LVVVAIIAILASLLLPALSKARDKARTIGCLSNEKQLGISCMLYVGESDGFFMPYFNVSAASDFCSKVNGGSYGNYGGFNTFLQGHVNSLPISVWGSEQKPDNPLFFCPADRGRAPYPSGSGDPRAISYHGAQSVWQSLPGRPDMSTSRTGKSWNGTEFSLKLDSEVSDATDTPMFGDCRSNSDVDPRGAPLVDPTGQPLGTVRGVTTWGSVNLAHDNGYNLLHVDGHGQTYRFPTVPVGMTVNWLKLSH